MHKLFTITLLLLFTSWANALSTTMEIEEAELQERATAMMPIVRKEAFFSITVSNPIVDLIKESNKVGLTCKIAVNLLGSVNGEGHINMAANLHYKPEHGAFYLSNIEVLEFESKQIKPSSYEAIKSNIAKALNLALKDQPIYTLDDNKVKETLAKSVLQEVEVKDEKLILTLGVF